MCSDNLEAYIWYSNVFACYSNDIDRYYELLSAEIRRLNLDSKVLTTIGDYPLYFIESKNSAKKGKQRLISAGFHGEEPAGPWGILHFLSCLEPTKLTHINLNILPLVNPTGFAKGRRLNNWGENPNRGFPHPSMTESTAEQASLEGLALLENLDLLKAASKDGFLTCHEDVCGANGYVYTYESQHEPGTFSKALRDTLACYFPIVADGEVDGCRVNDGIIFNHFDSSFESFLVSSGITLACCSETPGMQNLDLRIQANAELISAFLGRK